MQVKNMKRKEIVNDLKCDELCFIGQKRVFRSEAEQRLRKNSCPPCWEE